MLRIEFRRLRRRSSRIIVRRIAIGFVRWRLFRERDRVVLIVVDAERPSDRERAGTELLALLVPWVRQVRLHPEPEVHASA